MEHIVQFAVSVDDDGIQKRVEDGATRAIIKALQNDGILSRYYEDRPSEMFAENVARQFCREYEDVLIDGIVKYCGEKLCKRKSFVDKVTAEIKAEGE